MIRACAVLGGILCLATPAVAQQSVDSLADRPLATREQLQAAAQQAGASEVAVRIKTRLTEGDFRRGDRIALRVQGEPALNDTFVVGSQRDLMLPPPTVGSLPLKGVLRSELEPKLIEYVGRFRTNAVVRAEPLIRLSIQGEVTRAGVYSIPAGGRLADALMAAGGTTQFAKPNRMSIERNGAKIWEGASFETDLDALNLRDGDQIVVDSKRPGTGNDNLRVAALLVSMAAGLYGLSRAFKH
ncbi:MAG TPA: SLBB domain-containing protein [Gemmatimonadales bacterium]|nr:SLBB domain-containing protein [Gemmatimonadales bacterium]